LIVNNNQNLLAVNNLIGIYREYIFTYLYFAICVCATCYYLIPFDDKKAFYISIFNKMLIKILFVPTLTVWIFSKPFCSILYQRIQTRTNKFYPQNAVSSLLNVKYTYGETTIQAHLSFICASVNHYWLK